MNDVAFEFNGLAGADFAAFAGFELTIHGDVSLRDNCFAFAAGHDKIHGLEQLAEFDVFIFDGKGHTSYLIHLLPDGFNIPEEDEATIVGGCHFI